MALDPPRDLPPRYDVRGGSPRTPTTGIPVRDYQDYVEVNAGNGVWKTLAGAAGGLWIMSLLAWWTAFQGKGISRFELQEYVDKYSPYSQQKEVIAAHFANQDISLGELRGKSDKAYERLNKVENDTDKCEREILALSNEVKTKMDIVATMLEQQKAKK